MLRPLLTLRFAALTLLMVGAVWLFLFAGQWQWGKHVARDDEITRVEQGAAAAPVPASSVLRVGAAADADLRYHVVSARGRYDAERQLVVRFRALNGQPGSHLLVPLITDEGPALWVDRGFLPQLATGGSAPEIPSPPAGEIVLLGRIAASESGFGTGGDPQGSEIRFVDVTELSDWLPYESYGDFVELVSQTPAAPAQLQLLPAPDINPGPYLSYGAQWYLFALTAIAGWVALGVRDVREARTPRRPPSPAAARPQRRRDPVKPAG